MAPGDAFVAEISVELKNLIESTDKQTLEVKLRSDAQKEIDPEGVVVRFKRLGRSSTRNRLHHGCLDLDERTVFEEAANFTNDGDALFKNFQRLRVGDQVEVALAVFDFRVLNSVPLVGKGTKGFR